MEQPWFKLNPNNDKDKWWLYTSITNTKTAIIPKKSLNISCHFIIKYINKEDDVNYRILTWFKNDPNRYLDVIRNDNSLTFQKKLEHMKDGEIVKNDEAIMFEVYECKFYQENKDFVCKILERIDDESYYIFILNYLKKITNFNYIVK